MNRDKQSKLLREALSAATAISLFSLLPAMADSFEWSAAVKPSSLADDAVQFEYSGDSVSAITVSPVDGGAIWISGDEMPVAADATITFTAPGTLGFSNAVTCAGNLMVNGSGEMTRSWHDGLASTFTTAADLKASLLPTNFVTLFTDMNLDEWEPYAYYGARTENKANPAISTSDIQLNPNSSQDSFLEFLTLALSALVLVEADASCGIEVVTCFDMVHVSIRTVRLLNDSDFEFLNLIVESV